MPSRRDLVGKWIHVFEEDTEQGAVYRRDGGDVPLRALAAGFFLAMGSKTGGPPEVLGLDGGPDSPI